MTTDPTPTEITSEYREALRKLYGDDIADKSAVYYFNGWYYYSVGRKCPDGSIYVHVPAAACRKKQMIMMTYNLLHRVDGRKVKREE